MYGYQAKYFACYENTKKNNRLRELLPQLIHKSRKNSLYGIKNTFFIFITKNYDEN